MDPIIESPSVAADPPDEMEVLHLATMRLLLSILNASGLRGLTPAAAAERIVAVAEIFEREVARAPNE